MFGRVAVTQYSRKRVHHLPTLLWNIAEVGYIADVIGVYAELQTDQESNQS